MSVRRTHGGITNQAGAFAPVTSAWGQQLAAAQGTLVDQPLPIGTRKRRGYGGTVGGVTVLAASTRPVAESGRSYFGDLPQSQQNTVPAAPPWERA